MKLSRLLHPHQNVCEQTRWLYLKDSAIFGKGVFTRKKLRPGETIEKCPVILLEGADVEKARNTVLYWYYFVAGDREPKLAVALGYGSVYNHQCPANATFELDVSQALLFIRACETIEAGSEITINYNGAPTDGTPVSFQQDGIVYTDDKK